ncbi:NADPH-dependent FMN reductase [Synechococcus sp. Nb3U1]|uniref:NADPH-dependent FMN reductase n=1 Tax=Synechococcus sp. Nb3U1 TaxID=1914529 RepID=UPI001F206CE3|nr:NADPH-dependent FMN reductase [Synechococcus sp. Nb3U1]MCF2972681.1 NADPH-dependent FMN reductase [Synechococcus sp. Nb3U1]
MPDILLLSGSPSANSRSEAVLHHAAGLLPRQGFTTPFVSVRDLPPEDLVLTKFDSPQLKQIQAQVAQADGILISAPVYKASYPGVFKALLDLLDQDALTGKVILPMATGGTLAHLLAIDFAMKPVLSVMGATHILKGIYILSAQIQFDADGKLQLEAEIEERLQAGIQSLVEAVNS